MRPYLAIIADSFSAALSSRILWIALVAIWLLLAALAPIGYREDFTTTFRDWDFHNPTQMKVLLAKGLVDPQQQQAPVGRLARAMPSEVQRQLNQIGQGEDVRIWTGALTEALNEMLDNEDWYDAEAWKSTLRLKELRDLDETDDQTLSESLRRRRARLRIEAAMPGVFEARNSRSVVLTYAGLDFPARFVAVSKPQFVTVVNQYVVPEIINWLLGFVLVFLGILVTAHLIPDLLQPGSLHLLLSKPVSRTLLFLSKFLGGCAFVLLCVVQLVVGLYLIAGLRLDVWNARVLWCIPVSAFLFSVFYSVSAVAGLRWRSSIVAIGVTCVFGLCCFVIGFVGALFDDFVTRPAAVRHIVVADGTLIGTTQGSGLVRYSENKNRWIEIFESEAMGYDRVLPPIRLGKQHVVSARLRGGRLNAYGFGASDMLVLDGQRDWAPEPSLRLPAATSLLFPLGSEDVLAINSSGLLTTNQRDILEATGKETEEESPEEDADSKDTPDILGKLANMLGGPTSGFVSILPKSITVTPPRGVVVGEQGDWLILFTRGRLFRLEKPADSPHGRWRPTAERQLEGELSRGATIALNGNTLLLARDDDPIFFIDAQTFDTLGEVELPNSLSLLKAQGLGDGKRFALLTSDGRCCIADVQADQSSKLDNWLPIADIETIYFSKQDQQLLIVHHTDCVDRIATSTMEIEPWVRPEMTGWRAVEYYAIGPLRFVTPQTGELGEAIASMVSGKSAMLFDTGTDEQIVVRYNIVRPVLSCAGFITFMLGIGCVYFSRRDF
ncbi:MAG: ABC transporter permease [Pirellulales bacterium]|nr:ABC transporter permease [Pirellulales bacterium]